MAHVAILTASYNPMIYVKQETKIENDGGSESNYTILCIHIHSSYSLNLLIALGLLCATRTKRVDIIQGYNVISLCDRCQNRRKREKAKKNLVCVLCSRYVCFAL